MADPSQIVTMPPPKGGVYYGWVFVAVCLLLLTLDYGLSNTFVAFFGLAYGAEVPVTPMLTKKCFGAKRMATLVGLFFLAGLISGAGGPIVGGRLFDETGSYQTTFIVVAVVVAVAFIPLLAMKVRDTRALAMVSSS